MVQKSLCVCVRVSVCVCVSPFAMFIKFDWRYSSVCVSLHSSETIKVLIIKLGKVRVTASNMVLYHMLLILTLTYIHGHTDLNHENNTCLIISETVPSNPHHVAVKIVKPKV